jgi:thioredoxin reductase (NADPH)
METTVPILIGLSACALLCMGALFDDRRARMRRRDQRDEPLRAVPLLHSINDDRCIGCEACVDVCPTEVLDLVDHKARVLRFSDCVQCEQCANACPTQALVMYRQGTTPRMLTVPELDEHFQTGVPGQYLIGEVAGKPLVKNAANLGRAVVEHIARELDARGGDILDVVIVGSGPGGLSAGLTCLKHKLSCLVLEKEHIISATVSRYPKGKHFMAEPSTAQNVSYLPVFDGTKEELVAAWKELIDAVKLPIRLGEAVESVKRGDDGVFTIRSTVGTYRARRVVLGTGLRGKPRLLAVPGANLEKVQSLLDDPSEFADRDVLVVGGGDSAIEGAMALADVGARVTLSYRGDGFKRCKQGNQKRLAELTAGHRLSVLLESNVTCFTPGEVTIALADKTATTIANHHAFVLIGADTPVAWLEANNVRFVERPHLYALGSSEDAVRRFVPDAAPCPTTAPGALAIVLDRPLSPVQRMRSVAHHVAEEIREVVTSISSVFRLTELEPSRAAPPAPSRVIPASRLTASARRVQPIEIVRSPDDSTDEIASLRAREHQARLIAACRPEPPTEELAGLRAREHEALIAASRVPSDSSRLHRILRDDDELPVRPLDGATEIDQPSLRALDGATELDMPSLRTLEGATELDMRSLRALESATVLDKPSLRAAEGARPRRPLTTSVVTSAKRPPPLPPRTAAIPPPVPSRDAMQPSPPVRPGAVPPPLPRAALVARGSEGFPKAPPQHPPAVRPEPSEPRWPSPPDDAEHVGGVDPARFAR